MSNPLMGVIGEAPTNNSMARLMNIALMVRNGNPEQIAKSLMQQNPQFRKFVESNRGKARSRWHRKRKCGEADRSTSAKQSNNAIPQHR